MQERIYRDSEIGDVLLVKSPRSRRISIRVHPDKGVRVGIPYYMTYEDGLKFFLSRREWVREAIGRQKSSRENVDPVTVDQLREMIDRAVEDLPTRFFRLQDKYGLRARHLSLKNNVSNWGSCSTKGNINLNVRLMMLPEYLRDYVILHELSHLQHHDHSPNFHAQLERLCADHFSEGLPAGLKLSRSSRFPVSHALEVEIKKYHTTYQKKEGPKP